MDCIVCDSFSYSYTSDPMLMYGEVLTELVEELDCYLSPTSESPDVIIADVAPALHEVTETNSCLRLRGGSPSSDDSIPEHLIIHHPFDSKILSSYKAGGVVEQEEKMRAAIRDIAERKKLLVTAEAYLRLPTIDFKALQNYYEDISNRVVTQQVKKPSLERRNWCFTFYFRDVLTEVLSRLVTVIQSRELLITTPEDPLARTPRKAVSCQFRLDREMRDAVRNKDSVDDMIVTIFSSNPERVSSAKIRLSLNPYAGTFFNGDRIVNTLLSVLRAANLTAREIAAYVHRCCKLNDHVTVCICGNGPQINADRIAWHDSCLLLKFLTFIKAYTRIGDQLYPNPKFDWALVGLLTTHFRTSEDIDREDINLRDIASSLSTIQESLDAALVRDPGPSSQRVALEVSQTLRVKDSSSTS